MQVTLRTLCDVGRKMTTTRQKGSDLVTCQISVKGVRVAHEHMDELAGLPVGATATLFDELGAPRQRMSFLLPKRGLLAKGKLQLRRESGAVACELDLSATPAVCSDIRFNLDTPDDQGPTSMMSFTLIWKAAGDEVSDTEPLLACGDHREKAYMDMTFTEEPKTKPLFDSSSASKTAEEEAGHRAALDRKRQAAGEKASDDDEADDTMLQAAIDAVTSGKCSPSVSAVQRALKIGYNRSARLLEAMEKRGHVTPAGADGKRSVVEPSEIRPAPGNGETATAAHKDLAAPKGADVVDLTQTRFAREAKERAKKHPRKDPPPAPRGRGR